MRAEGGEHHARKQSSSYPCKEAECPCQRPARSHARWHVIQVWSRLRCHCTPFMAQGCSACARKGMPVECAARVRRLTETTRASPSPSLPSHCSPSHSCPRIHVHAFMSTHS